MSKVIHRPRLSSLVVPVGRIAFDLGASGILSTPQESSPEAPPEVDPEAIFTKRLAEVENRYRAEVEKAYRRGTVEGQEQTRREMEAEVHNVVERLTHLVDNVTLEHSQVLQEAGAFIVRLACEVARRIIDVSAVTNSEAILDVISRSIAHLVEKTSLTIRIHPDDLEIVRRHRADWLAPENGIERIVVESDPEISRGGCIIEADSGIVDGRIGSQLKLLQDELLKKVTG